MINPKLSIYVGESQISALKYVSPKDFKFTSYSYSLLDSLFHNQDHKLTSRFLNEVLQKVIAKDLEINLDEFDLLIGNASGTTLLNDKAEVFSLSEALGSISNFSWLMVENFLIYTPKDFLNLFPYSEFKDNDEYIDYFSNKTLYPHFIPKDRQDIDKEEELLHVISNKIEYEYDSKTPIVFTGGKFSGKKENLGYMYVSSLNFLKNPGLYEIRLDRESKLPALGLINHAIVKSKKSSDKEVSMLMPDILDDSLFYDEFINVGTVLKSFGKVECLFEKEEGSPQFVEIEQDEIFIFPLQKAETARISVSSGKTGKIERNITGGDIGFIIDTRSKSYKGMNPKWVEVFEERMGGF